MDSAPPRLLLLLLALLVACVRGAAPVLRPPLRAAPTPLARAAILLQAGSEQQQPGEDLLQALSNAEENGSAAVVSEESAAVAASAIVAPPLGPDGKPDLSAMSFDERLDYLASVAPDVAAPKEEDEASMFGFDGEKEETLWYSPKFYALCFQDLREMNYPTPKSVVQTVVTSQIAFVAIFVSILVFDAVAEAGIRSLIQGKPFMLSFDGSSTPTRGL